MQDRETIRLIAEFAARAAAQELRNELREEFKEMAVNVEDRVAAQLREHFGAMKPADHVVEHARLNKMLTTVESLEKNLIGKILIGALIVMIIVGFGGEVVVKKILEFIF